MSTVSVFIRARNEAEALGQTLRAIGAQDRRPDEVVVLDNESDDHTSRIAEQLGAVVHSIGRDQFSYGRALNRSMELTQGDIIVFVSAHSPPVSQQWLSNLVTPIERGEADATFGRQVPEPGVNHLEEWIVHRTFPRRPGPIKAMLRLQKITFSNANAAVLTRVLREQSFREDLEFAEDIEWAQRLGLHGYQVQYCPDAAVFHSHRFGPGELQRRMEAVGRAMGRQGAGRVYRNPLSRGLIHLGAMTVDLIYCIVRGYWRSIVSIPAYRGEYFRGLRRGLRQTQGQ
ncbi:MAG: glycosyltransferase [Phycisphaeraceae bacterium]